MRALDVALPEFDWNEVHDADLPGTPERALASVLSLPVAPDPIVGTLLRLRGLGRGPTIGEAFPRIGFERIAAVDEAARRSFRRYWLVVGPFSALVRRRWLAAARRAVLASA